MSDSLDTDASQPDVIGAHQHTQTPKFNKIGDIVKVTPDTNPSVHPRFSVAILAAEVVEINTVNGTAIILPKDGMNLPRKRHVGLDTIMSELRTTALSYLHVVVVVVASATNLNGNTTRDPVLYI